MHQRFLLSIPLLLLALSPLPAAAHNGAVAIAVPVKGITVDGDFSDWPAGMTRYPIAQLGFGVRPRDEQDFQGSFRIGYSALENALYLAVEMQDESAVIDTLNPMSEDTQDGCRVWVDAGHEREKEIAVGYYSMLGDTPGTSGSGVRRDDFKVAVHRDPQVQRYEWRIDIQQKTQGQVPLRPGMSLGFDLSLGDRDADGTWSWVAWGPSVDKFGSSRLGDVLLVGEAAATGTMKVAVRWEGSGAGVGYVKVQIQPPGSAAEQWQARTDRKGLCAVELPAGVYEIAVGRGGGVQEKARVEVKGGSATEVPLVMSAPAGLTVPAGKGKRIKAGSGIQQGTWQTLGAADGLLAISFFGSGTMLQDREGNLWFGTEGRGVCRYDGVQFVYFTKEDGLADDQVSSIGEDREGHLWFGTPRGVSRYDWQRFITFTDADGLAGNEVQAIVADREGHLWFGTDAGASRYEGKQFTTFTTAEGLAGNYVNAIAADRDGNLWFGTGGGVSRYGGKAWTTFTAEEGLAGNDVWAMVQDQQGQLWFATFGGGVSRYDGTKWTTFTTTEGLGHNKAQSIAVDGEGHLWVGTWGGGVSRYDGKIWTTFTAADGLASDQIVAALTDREGDLWFAALGGGVSRYSAQHSTTFTTKDGLVHNLVKVCLEDLQGNLWFGCPLGGCSRFDGKAWTTFTTREGLGSNRIQSGLVDRQGQVWFGTIGGGVSRYDGKTWTTFTIKDGLTANSVRSIAEDREGNLWFGTGNGVSRYDGQRFRTFTTGDGLGNNSVSSVLLDREGSLWFGTPNWVSRYDGKTWTTLPTPEGMKDSSAQFLEGMENSRVASILQDRDRNLWFGTSGGSVFRYDGKKLVDFSTQVGLADNGGVNSSMEDRRGHLWFGTWGGGIRLYDGTVFQRLQKPDGLPSELVQDMVQTRNGDIWIATESGATRYRPGKFPPAVRLIEVLADRSYGPATEIDLPSTQDYLSFVFEGASLRTRPERMVYVYRLLGHDDQWRQVNEGRVEYPDLPVGDYVFEVKAVDPDLNYSEVPATVKVEVHLPYGQFALYGLLGVLGLAVVWQAGRLVQRNQKLREANTAMSSANKELFSVNRQLEQTLEEKEKAQELLVRSESMAAIGTLVAGVAHELNNPLGAAYSLVQTVQEMVEEDTAEQLEQEKAEIVEHLAFSRKELNRAKEIVAALLGLSRQNQDYTEAVEVNTVVQDALRVLYNQYKKYEVNIAEEYEEGLPAVQGNFAQLGQVCMNLIKNAIEALKRQEGQITLKTYQEGGQVVFECADTGPGIAEEVRQNIFKPFFTTKPVGEGTGLGLYICHQTVEKHHGVIEVESEVGKGTVFRVRLPAGRT